MKPLREILRPIVKTMIVNRAIRGQLSATRAKRLIRERKLRSA